MYPALQRLVLDGLQRQLEYLELLQQRHLGWAAGTDTVDAKSKHLKILDSLRTMIDEYESLISIYSQEIEKIRTRQK